MSVKEKYIGLLVFTCIIIFMGSMTITSCNKTSKDQKSDFVERLISKMTLEEKIGQMSQLHGENASRDGKFLALVRDGLAGSVLNESDPEQINLIQHVAVDESRLGIPVLFARDVIHGFKTIFPINIGLAATFNPELIRQSAAIWAQEAHSAGIRWTFAPMVDISRDPRWGRMAESFGEDVYLTTLMGLAVNEGFQQKQENGSIYLATCAKHFVGYGAVEGGRDYNTVNIPEIELHNTYFKPFKTLSEAGVSTFMTSFTDLNGVPASGNSYLFREVLKTDWGFQGFVVSDWASIEEQITHGYAENPKEAAKKAVLAGVDMEMASGTFAENLKQLVEDGVIPEAIVDEAVRRILTLKLNLGLFDQPYAIPDTRANDSAHLILAKEAALQSMVLLKNDNEVLPLSPAIKKLAVIGPMANDRYEQLSTWIFDGDTNLTITPLAALQKELGETRVVYAPGLDYSRDRKTIGFEKAVKAAESAEAVVVIVGEEAIITGEAHSRAGLELPGAQNELIKILSETGKPVIVVIMTSRPLTIGSISDYAEAIIYAWHPGTMGGPALADILLGYYAPSGKLPVTFPKVPGQIPIYYSHKNTGRPPSKESWTPLYDIPVRAFQTSVGNTSHYLDAGFEPLYPFGFGLSYTSFEYSNIKVSSPTIKSGDTLRVCSTITNTGKVAANEVVQFYLRDVTAEITRPVKELKGIKRLFLSPGQQQEVCFEITEDDLVYYDKNGKSIIENGIFYAWIGGDSTTELKTEFVLEK